MVKLLCAQGKVMTLHELFGRNGSEESYSAICDELKKFKKPLKIINEQSTSQTHSNYCLLTTILSVSIAAMVVLVSGTIFYFAIQSERGELRMENIIIGKDSLQLHDIVRVMATSVSPTKFQLKWGTLSQNLGVSDKIQHDLDRKLNTGALALKNLPRELVKVWQIEKGDKATLKVLHDALVKCDMRNIADSLWKAITASKSAKSVTFEWQGNVATLEDLLEKSTSLDVFQKIYFEFMKKSYEQPIQLFIKQVTPPPLPKYYVSRTLQYITSTEVDTKMFNSELAKNHVFLFKNSSKPELARLTYHKEPIDTSENQLRFENIKEHSVRFILLEWDEDFNRIIKKTQSPTHVIQQDGEKYFWVRSSKESDIIRGFLKDPRKNISEEGMVTRIISLPSPIGISIADSPGTGKSFMMANLAGKIQLQPRHIVMLIVLQEFVKERPLPDSSVTTLEAVADYASCDKLSKLVLLEMMKAKSYQVYLFLDGYDEVMQDKLDFVDLFLNHLQKLTNFKIIVTTTLSVRERLENLFRGFSYSILPYTKPDQINFLTQYWIYEHRAKKGEVLTDFAQRSLAVLQMDVTFKEKQVFGTPLQCMIIGEVFAEDAKRASDLEALNLFNELKPIPMFRMYHRLIDLKFSRIQRQEGRNIYLNAHILEAVKMVFPGWVKHLKPLLNGTENVKESNLYSISLLERSAANTPKFIHRTFAEYLLAEFIVRNLSKHFALVELLFGEILGKKGAQMQYSWSNPLFTPYISKYSGITYFIEMHLKHQPVEVEEFLLSNYSTSTKFDTEDVCMAVVMCSINDMESTFDYVSKNLQLHPVGEDLRDQYFKDLPHGVALYSNYVSMIVKVFQLTKFVFNVSLSYHTLMNFHLHQLTIPKYTPLHEAVRKGKYNTATYLIHHVYGDDEVRKLHHLLHVCLYQSIFDGDSAIGDKMLIVDMLLMINHNWIEEKDRKNRIPLVQTYTDLSLLKLLLDHGANINSHNDEHGTLLHCQSYTFRLSYIERVRWAFSNGFNLINHTDIDGRTPLIFAMQELRSVKVGDELLLLRMFHEQGADFNAQDRMGDSVLFHALKKTLSLDFIKKLLEYGADVNYTNNMDQRNALHKVVQGFGGIEERLQIIDLLVSINPGLVEQKNHEGCVPFLEKNVDLRVLQRLVKRGSDINAHCKWRGTVLHASPSSQVASSSGNYIELFRWALSSGFKLINHIDLYGRTPIMHALMEFGHLDHEVLSVFQKAGADYNAKDYRGDSVLFYALEYSGSIELMKKLLEYGANVNHENVDKQNALHKVMFGSGSVEDRVLIIDMLLEINREWLGKEDSSDCTPLLRHNGNLRLIQHLVHHHGADINSYSRICGTVIHWMARKNLFSEPNDLDNAYRRLVRWALSNGFVLINHVNGDNLPPLMQAMRQFGSVEIEVLEMFHKAGANFNAQDNEGDSVLFHALMNPHSVDFIGKLMEYGVDVNHRNKMKQNALHKLMNNDEFIANKLLIIDMFVKLNRGLLEERDQNDCPPILQWNVPLSLLKHLVKHGANINAYSEKRGTIHHSTFSKDAYMDMAYWTLSNGFVLTNHTNKDGKTALMYIMEKFGSVDDELLAMLLNAKADLNAQDNNGDSVLFYALKWSGTVDLIMKLLEFGADVNHRNFKNQNALHKIVQRDKSTEDRLVLIDMLITSNPSWINDKDNEECTPLLTCDSLKLLQRLKEHGADINAYSKVRGTLLHGYFFSRNYPFVIRWAFANGFALVNHKNRYGSTTLMNAILVHGPLSDEVLELFHGAGADFNAQDNHNDSVLFYAIQRSLGNVDFIRKILEYGADVNHTNISGDNAAHIVVRAECLQVLDVLKLLQSKGFCKFNQKDSMGYRPAEMRHIGSEAVAFLKSNNCD